MPQTTVTVPGQKKGLPATPTLVLIGLLAIIVIALLIWALYNYQMILNRSLSVSQNPYCIRMVCGKEGQVPIPIELTKEEDPQKTAYQTINWCTVNAPPETLTMALQQCSTGTVEEALDERLADFASFYNNEYIPTCGFTWKSSVTVSETYESDANNPDNPNGYLLTGTNDYTLMYTVACADKVGLSDSNVEELRELCGAPCQTTA